MRRRFLLLLTLISLAIPPTALAQAEQLCFKEVPDCVEGRFAEYWRQNGGLAVFGLPLGPARQEQVGGGTYMAQLFERNRFELHTENARPYDVLLGRLGDERLRQLGRDWQRAPKGQPKDGCQFFGASGHTLCEPFLSYWRAHGLEFDGGRGTSAAESLALFGLPLTEPRMETNSSGDTVLTQWFERARFEHHPGNSTPYQVLLGRLGAETQASDPCAGIPASVNATATPNCFKAGTTAKVRASGFKANERVNYTVKPPAGVDIPAFFLSGAQVADARGVVEIAGMFPVGTPPGLYSIGFRGAESGRTGMIYFKILGN
ncbi:MAG: hypothetical protein ACJ8CR_22865 [Roseiflexaceae bacterium]